MFENEDEDNQILLGQMCYDELEPIPEKEEEIVMKNIDGQMGFEDFCGDGMGLSKQAENKNQQNKNYITDLNKNIDQQKKVDQENGLQGLKNKDLKTDVNLQNFDEKQENLEKMSKKVQRTENLSQNQSKEDQIRQIINNQYNQTKNDTEKVMATKNDSQSGAIPTQMGILYKSLEEVLHESMIPYTEHVVMDRALPRVEDGLKPVQRRILYAMYGMGLMPDKPYRKSATVVGECLGKFHPHGDSSVYDASVRMVQDFSLRDPLIDGHGNFGSIDGDSAAAYRYTEMKLKPLALELLKDIEKNTVHWSLNFDDRLKEPDTLPGRFPNLLVNGAYGIAVGVATNIAPHNLAEVIDAVVAYIDKPSIDTKGLMKYIKGPDFPTGANVVANEELYNAYLTGKGKLTVRANVLIETAGDRQNLVITEIPYQVNKAQLLQKIAQLKEENKEKLACIQEIRDESDRTGMRAVIRLKKDANAKAILDFLYKATNLQTTFGMNMVAIAGGKPKQMGLVEIISYYVEYQRQVVYRRTKFDLDACKDKAHILEGLLVAIQNIDEVIKIIKKSESVALAKQKLKERFLLSEKQAVAILEMRLSRLVNLEVNKIKEELAYLKAKIEELTAIYMSRAKQFEVVKKEILELKKQYKSPRRTKLLDPTTLSVEEIPEEEVVVKDCYLALTANKTVKAIPVKNYNLAVKELSENSSLSEIHTTILKTKSTDKVLVFTNLGNVYKTTVSNIPEAKWRERGTDLNKLDKNLIHGEEPISIISLEKEPFEMESAFVTMVTESGMIKKSPLSEYTIAKTVFAGIKLKDKDKVVYADISDGGNILIVAKSGMAVNIVDDTPATGRTTAGVKAMALDDGDKVVACQKVKKNGAITVLSSKGYVKNVSIGEYETMSRNRKGLRITGKDTGDVKFISFGVVPPDIAVVDSGKIFLIKSKYIPYDNRAGKGKQMLKDEFKSAYQPLN